MPQLSKMTVLSVFILIFGFFDCLRAQQQNPDLLSTWLTLGCEVGQEGAFEAELAQAGAQVLPGLIKAAQNGPDNSLISTIQSRAGHQFDLIASSLADAAELGLSADDVQNVRNITRENFIAEKVNQFSLLYQSRALAGLGVVGGPTAMQVLQSFAQNNTSPLQNIAKQALQQLTGANTPPVANAGPNQMVECSSHNGTPIRLNGSATDPDGDSLTLVWKNSAGTALGSSPTLIQTLPLGTFKYSLIATDSANLSATASTAVTVHDTKPPTIVNLSTTPKRLRKHSHKMVPVKVNYTSEDQCSATVSCSLAVSSSEPNGTRPEWRIVDSHDVLLRAERRDGGKGRAYTITATCADPSGNKSSQKVIVVVRHKEEEDEDETEGHSE